MKRLIYYPGFEVQDTEWLKFALLYIDRLEPIIPPSGDKYLTRLFNQLSHETDLIQIHRPEYHEGEMATLDAIENVEKILRHPGQFSRIFRHANILDLWRNPQTHDYLLFEGKFTENWKSFCLNNGFATPAREGILLPTAVGHLYMTLLAQIISDSKGISAITDHTSLDRYAIFSRSFDVDEREKMTLARATINLKLPVNLKRISVDQLIQFRNQREFKQKLAAFHAELDNYFSNIEGGNSEKNFVESFDNVWKDFAGDILRLGVDTVSFGLGVWLAVNAPQITTVEYLKEIVVAGASLAIGSSIDISNTWKNTRTKL